MELFEFLRSKGYEISLTEDRKVSVYHRFWAHGPRVTTFSFGDDFNTHEIFTSHEVQKFLRDITGAHEVTQWTLD
jgi:hypothetical protein